MHLVPLIIWLSTASLLSGCGHVQVHDTVIWSFIGEGKDPDNPMAAAIGSHTNFKKHEYMTLDEWITFIQGTPTIAPSVCLSSRDYTLQKTALDGACEQTTCTYEEQEALQNIGEHMRLIKKITGVENGN